MRLIHSFLIFTLAITLCVDGFAAKKKSRNFKGLFGSYRSEQYRDNEARKFALGVNLNLSTLIPVSPIVNSSEVTGQLGETLNFAAFYNFELEVYYTLWYHWQVFARLGHYSYDTRKESSGGNVSEPIFHIFEMNLIPLMAGVRYRFGKKDIVPYISLAGGIASVNRKTIYDNEDADFADSENSTAILGELSGGLEFFFSPNAGIRLEISGFYLGVDEIVFDKGQTGATLTQKPIMTYRANPWLVRYSSGLFFFF